MARKPTLQDVATLAGVSLATADRVINRRGGVQPDRETRVLAAARQLKLDRSLARAYTRRLRVAVLIQGAVNPFHAALAAAFMAANRSFADLNMQFLVHHLDPNQAGRIAGLIDRLGGQHDGLIVNSPAGPGIAAAIRRVAAAIPVATFTTDIPDSGRHAYVGPDDRQAGRVAGELMGRFLGEAGGAVLMIAGLLAMTGHREREQGFRAALAEWFPACRLVAVEESREDAAAAGTIAAAALRATPGLRGLYLTSAGAGVVVAALEAAGRADVAFVTHELTGDRRQLLKRRKIAAVVDQDPSGEVQAVAATMARLLGRLDGEAGDVLTPVRIHTAENC